MADRGGFAHVCSLQGLVHGKTCQQNLDSIGSNAQVSLQIEGFFGLPSIMLECLNSSHQSILARQIWGWIKRLESQEDQEGMANRRPLLWSGSCRNILMRQFREANRPIPRLVRLSDLSIPVPFLNKKVLL